jgi:L-asparaginase
MSASKPVEVLLIYTGGTIGSAPRDRSDSSSPQIVVKWEELYEQLVREFARLPYAVVVKSMDPPLDSCNVRPKHWQWMARTIEEHYARIHGVVILHGTDTMVYTAGALSFILQNLNKPVVITGAQRSAMVDVRNDAIQNVMTALELANAQRYGTLVVPEVLLVFGGAILRGNRAAKRDTSAYTAYESPNYPPLGEAGNAVTIDTRLVLSPPAGNRTFRAATKMDPSVAIIWIFPGVQDSDSVKRQLEVPGLKAAIVAVYGSGDIPTNDEFLEAFRSAHARGIILVAVTQCPRGPVELGIYETSAKLIEVGFIAGYDITLSSAQTKLMALLGRFESEDEEEGDRVRVVEDDFMRSLVGEQSRSTYLTRLRGPSSRKDSATSSDDRGRQFSLPLSDPFSEFANRFVRLRAQRLVTDPDINRIVTAKLRLRNARLTSTNPSDAASSQKCQFRIFMNLDPDEIPGSDVMEDKRLVCRAEKWASDDGVIMFDLTQGIRQMGQASESVSLTLVIDTENFLLQWSSADLALIVNELN